MKIFMHIPYNRWDKNRKRKVPCNISSMKSSVSSPNETLRGELKIRHAAVYFWRTSRCLTCRYEIMRMEGRCQLLAMRQTSHSSPPMKRNSKLDCECLEKGGPDGRQPWGPTLQTKNLQARGTTLQAWKNGQETQVGRKGNRQQLRKPKASNRQRQTEAIKTLAVRKRQLATLNKNTLTKVIHHWFGSTSYEVGRSSNILFVGIAFPMAQNLDEVIQNTALAAKVTALIRKLWLEKSPGRPAYRRIALYLSVSKERDKGRPFSQRNRGPGRLPRRSRKETTAWTANKGGEPGSTRMLHPFRKGSVLEALMQIWRQDGLRGTSTAISRTDRWRPGSKAERLGTVNSADLKNPK